MGNKWGTNKVDKKKKKNFTYRSRNSYRTFLDSTLLQLCGTGSVCMVEIVTNLIERQ